MNILPNECHLLILKEIIPNEPTILGSGLKYLATMAEVSHAWYLRINNYCQTLYNKSLFSRGIQIFSDKLITDASVFGPLPKSNPQVQSINTIVNTAMLGDVNQLKLCTIKDGIEFAVKNNRFSYSPFFLTLLKKLLEHQDTSIKQYILMELQPYLLNHSKAQNVNTEAALKFLNPYPPAYLNFMTLVFALILFSIVYHFLI